MDLNDIKPPGIDHANAGPVEETPSKLQSGDDTAQAFLATSEPASQQTPPLLKAVAHLDKTVFQDPVKLDGAVRSSISELINSGQGVTGPLSNSEKEFLTNTLAEDPLMRRQVEGLLRKVLN